MLDSSTNVLNISVFRNRRYSPAVHSVTFSFLASVFGDPHTVDFDLLNRIQVSVDTYHGVHHVLHLREGTILDDAYRTTSLRPQATAVNSLPRFTRRRSRLLSVPLEMTENRISMSPIQSGRNAIRLRHDRQLYFPLVWDYMTKSCSLAEYVGMEYESRESRHYSVSTASSWPHTSLFEPFEYSLSWAASSLSAKIISTAIAAKYCTRSK